MPLIQFPWKPDLGDGFYRNPIICADYSDPDVIRDGSDFYMIASSFSCTPGLPILHSRDLVNWTIINHAIKRLPDPRGVQHNPDHGGAVWAPAIRKHNGTFYIFFPMVDDGIYVTTATDPAGQWSEPWCLMSGKGLIDPCPLWDDDGKAYMVFAYARSRCGIKHRLSVVPMSPDARQIIGEAKTVYDDPENQPTLEGPKFHKFDGMYYISAPAGGVATGWQIVLRSKNIFGPYEIKRVLEQGPSPINGPHQGAIIDTPDGKEWWFIHFQDMAEFGRVIHLQPMHWKNGWPEMGIDTDGNGIGEPVLRYKKPGVGKAHPLATVQTTDEFDSPTLGLQWQWQANNQSAWFSLQDRPGFLRLFAQPSNDFLQMPQLLLQKFPARVFSVETAVELSGAAQAGLIIFSKAHAAIAIQPRSGGHEVVLIVNDQIVVSHPLTGPSVRLKASVDNQAVCRFSFAPGAGDFVSIGDAFQATKGAWIGAKVGLFCRSSGSSGAHADFDYFRFAK